MADEVVDGAVVPDDAPMPPEETAAIDEAISSMQLAVHDDSDTEAFLRMDEHDIRLLLERVQKSALRKWVYQLPYGKGEGLTVHAVTDVTQTMNWLGKCRIGVLPETLDVQRQDLEDDGKTKTYWIATIFAKDEMTGAMLPGSSMEPLRMEKRDGSSVFDSFSRWKAIQKATRNALAAFIPQEVQQTIIAMALKDPSRVERIQTEQEQKVAELPAPLDDERAQALNARARVVYDEIKELGGGRGKVEFTPGTFGQWSLQAQHSHDLLEQFVAYLEKRRDDLAEHYAGGGS